MKETKTKAKATKGTHGANPTDQPQQDPMLIHYMCACMAIYKVEDAVRQRYMNIMITSTDPNLTKDSLAQVQTGAIRRLGAENDVKPNDVKDIVILSLFPLGVMTPEQFAGSYNKTPAH